MSYVTLLVVAVVAAATALLCLYLARVLVDAGQTRRNYRTTVEGLQVRALHAADADRERARDSKEIADATRTLAQQVTEVQETLALERKLRKAIRNSDSQTTPGNGF